jgi:hypothetical protein
MAQESTLGEPIQLATEDAKERSGINLISVLRYGLNNINTIKFYKSIDELKNVLGMVNIQLGKIDFDDAAYERHLDEYDYAAVMLAKGKWYARQAMISGEKPDAAKADKTLSQGTKFAKKLLKKVEERGTEPLSFPTYETSNKGTEIQFIDEVPLLPEINPVVILQGSDEEMGYQYAQQLIEIFGPWILEFEASSTFAKGDLAELRRWEAQLERHAPEILGFCRGWARGATENGVEMTYDQVLDLWTGHKPPLKGYLGEDGLPTLGLPLCSGAAAWGRATKDGRLVTASTGDHDPAFTVTIVAYPETGNSFMFTPFGATGAVPKGGPLFLFGHPAMNSAGVAYVHHGGGPKWIEPKETWGYGIRRAASVFHIMRFANSAREARQMEEEFPIGDNGSGDPGTAGGFYADDKYGYIFESRRDPVLLREAGLMGETDFLYATNAPVHPEVARAPWRAESSGEWAFDENAGWLPPTAPGKITFQTFLLSLKKPHIIGLEWAGYNSFHRNRSMFDILNRGVGNIDLDYMKMMYRRSGKLPEGSRKQIVAGYSKGEWSEIPASNSANATVTIMKPSEGIFAHCVGPARRGLSPLSAKQFAHPIRNETNSFWELKLGDDPKVLIEHARKAAAEYIGEAEQLVAQLDRTSPAHARLKGFLESATFEIEAGDSSRRNGVIGLARIARAYTRAQVRARQVINALVPPATSPEELRSS